MRIAVGLCERKSYLYVDEERTDQPLFREKRASHSRFADGTIRSRYPEDIYDCQFRSFMTRGEDTQSQIPSANTWTTDTRRPTRFALPPVEIQNRPLDLRLIRYFSKMWDKTSSYTGDAYDVLDDKMLNLLDMYNQVGIRMDQVHSVFRIALTGRTRDYYLHNIPAQSTFATQYIMLKNYLNVEINHDQ